MSDTQDVERPITALDVNERVKLAQAEGSDVVPIAIAVLTNEDGSQEIIRIGDADADQARFYHANPVLFTGLVWHGLDVGERVRLASDQDLPMSIVTESDVIDVLPKETRAYLEFWQRQVMSGECWHAPGSIGQRAAELVDTGYLLHARRKLCDAYGHALPTRYDEQQGRPGTDAYVLAMMGTKYLAWVKSIV